MSRKLLVTSVAGDPAARRTWSGTPAQLMAALRADGRLEPVACATRVQGSRERLARALDRALGLGHPFIPGPARQRAAGGIARSAAAERGCDAILHLGSWDVPRNAGGRPQYLYVDNTFGLWQRHAAAARGIGTWRARWFRGLEAGAFARMRHVFTVGRHVADDIVAGYGVDRARVTAVGSGAGSIQPYEGPKDYARGELLTVAKVRPEDKGLPALVQAFALARRQRPDLRLTVIGGAGSPHLQGQDGVHGTGWITQEELQQAFERASLYVMPATFEPWGLSYVEALACRVPVMGLARNALPEIADGGRCGFLLPSAEPAALAAAILDALADPARLERMGQAGFEQSRGYSWARVAGRIADVVARDLQGRGSATSA